MKKAQDILLFKLTSSPRLTEEVAEELGIEVSPSEVNTFADGELLARPLNSVRGKTVYVIQSTQRPVTERLMELLIFIDGLRNAKAKEINAIIPYFGFARQDRIARSGEPITAKLVASLLGTVGINRLMTMDLHTPQIQGFFSCPVDNLSPISLFGEYFRRKFKNDKIPTDRVVVVSPDHGSIHRARDLASELPDASLAVIDKRRPAPNEAEVVNVVGDVQGKVALIVDDIIDTAGTVIASSEALRKRGASDILLAGTHGVFSHDSLDRVYRSGISDIVVTNSIESADPRLHIISIAPMIAGIIRANEEGVPVPDSWMSYY